MVIMQATLQHIVHISPAAGYCAHSPMSLHDSFPNNRGAIEDVVGIAKVTYDGDVVGWIYRAASGRFFAQVDQNMPLRKQQLAHTLAGNLRPVPGTGRRLSPIVRIGNVSPWPDLIIKVCKDSEYDKKI